MSGSRGFYRDDCRSGDRLAREWTRIAGADNLSVEWQADIGKFAYTITRVGVQASHIWRWMASPSMPCFDVYYLSKKNMQAPNQNRPCLSGLMFDTIDTNNYSLVGGSDQLYFGRFFGGVYYYKLWVVSLTNDVWYAVRVRRNQKDVRLKIWQYGTAEPDWQYTQSTAPGASNENPVRFQVRGGSTFGIVDYLYAVGDYCKIADLRITPIRKVGGP